MGLTLIRKSDGARRKRKPTVALVLAGGAVSGGAFKVGGLKALNDFLVDRKITDLDLYVGLSAGSILAVSLAAGITPDEMIKVLDGTSSGSTSSRPFDFYNPNLREFVDATRASFVYDLQPTCRASRSTSAQRAAACRRRSGPAARVPAQAQLHALSKCSRWR